MLAEDFADSRLVPFEPFSARPFFFRLATRSAKLMAPIL
jgi:hypothetical protein